MMASSGKRSRKPQPFTSSEGMLLEHVLGPAYENSSRNVLPNLLAGNAELDGTPACSDTGVHAP